MNRPVRTPIPSDSQSPGGTRRSPFHALAQRVSLPVALLAVLAALAGIGSLWYSNQAAKNLRIISETILLTDRLSVVQFGWMDVVGALDMVSVTRPAEQDREDLKERLSTLNQALDGLGSARELGTTPSKVEENRQILVDLRDAYRAIDSLTTEIFDLAADNRWGTALQRRQAGMAELQPRLLDSLNHLNANLQGDAAALSSQISREQTLARLLAAAAAALALLIAISIFRIEHQVISRPLGELVEQVNGISQSDFYHVKPFPRTDALGRLSQAIVQLSEWVQSSSTEMERRILERTEALEKRTVQVQAAAQTARDITSARSLNQLLDNAVELIRERFGFYHAGIFLADPRGEYQILRAATGEAGRSMLARAHTLRIGEAGEQEPTGLVGAAAYRGEALVSAEVSQDQAHYKNPLLPETRSEAALPLIVGGRVIGVLDVQSRLPQAFDPESLSILQVMADQLAIAIQNASLLNEVQRNLADVQRAYGELEHKAWLRYFQAAPDVGYVYDGVEIRPLKADAPDADGELDTSVSHAGGVPSDPFIAPLRVRGEEIGALEVWPRQGKLSGEERYLLETLNSRLSQILESARLYEETQARAAREELINQLTTHIARALDVDGVLRTAAAELGMIPTVSEAVVKLAAPEPAPNPAATGGISPGRNKQDGEAGAASAGRPDTRPENGRGQIIGQNYEDGGGNGHRA